MNPKKPLRKSVKKEAKKGNKAKYESYREAFSRIKAANESGFFLEAIAIQEALITDRLKSHLGHLEKLPDKYGFAKLIKEWSNLNESHANVKITISLPLFVNQWRLMRNIAIHEFISKQDIDLFLESGEAAAKTGALIARAVCDWHKGEVRKAKLNNKSPKNL